MPRCHAALALALALQLTGAYELRGRSVALTIGAQTCNVYSAGARGDGVTDDTQALQRAIAQCSTGVGGTILLPANGTFLSRALTMPAAARGTALQIDGTLRFSNDTKAYKGAAACLTLAGADVALLGAGTVDGQGAAWWPCAKAGCARPNLVNAKVANLLVRALRFVDSPNHNLELYSAPLEVDGVTILAPPSEGVAVPSHNTDGIDVHGSPAHIHSSRISVGDDHVAMHANDTLVEGCAFGTGHGTSIGSLGEGTFLQNITVRSCSFAGATTALRIKADNASSGALRGVAFRDLALADCGASLAIGSTYPAAGGPSGSTLAISDVSFVNITSARAGAAGALLCSRLAPCTGLLLEGVTHAPAPAAGWRCENARGQAQGAVSPPLGACLS